MMIKFKKSLKMWSDLSSSFILPQLIIVRSSSTVLFIWFFQVIMHVFACFNIIVKLLSKSMVDTVILWIYKETLLGVSTFLL